FELGRGVSADEVATRGVVAVFVEHLQRIVRPLTERGIGVQFWDDFARRDPAQLLALPTGAEALVWTYEAPAGAPVRPPEAAAAMVALLGYDPFDGRGFETFVEPVAATGFPFRVAPGTSSWNSLVGRIDNARANILDACDTGVRYGAAGLLLTDWGDNGHLQPPSVSFGPLLYAGAAVCCRAANADLDLAAVLDQRVFEDGAGR